LDIPFINALFEGTAGFTTTGTTILNNIETLPRSILIWRSLMQWLGGIGIIAFFLAFQSGIPGSHKLYSAESSKLDIQRPVPGLVNTLRILWKIYLIGTGFMILFLWIQKVPIFVAINHGLTCVSTGGFSTFDSSIQGFQNLPGVQFTWVQFTFMIGMIFGSTNFLLHFRFLTGQWKAIFDTQEMKTWIFIMVAASLLILLFSPNFSFVDSLFQIISLSSTTGYAIHPFSSVYMTPIATFLFFLIMFVGGCDGSTTGGVKVQRILLIGKAISREIKKLWAPEEATLPVVIDQRIVPENAVQQALTIISIWILTILVGTLLLLLSSPMSLKTAFSAQLSAVSNIGPSFMDPIALAASNWFVKTILIISMVAGRIEILPLLLLFQKKAWS
jgi:trk system potassium uptake protein TrkH